MSFNFYLADFVSRLNVASKAHMFSVNIPNNLLNLQLLQLFYNNGLIDYYKVLGSLVEVKLRYSRGMSVFSSLSLVSKPSSKVYWRLARLDLNYRCANFGGFYVLSTHQGLLTSYECIAYKRLSGEVLLKIVL